MKIFKVPSSSNVLEQDMTNNISGTQLVRSDRLGFIIETQIRTVVCSTTERPRRCFIV